MEERGELKERQNLPRINFRPVLFAAAGLASGIFLSFRLILGSFRFADLILPVLLLALGLVPLTKKRLLAILLSFVLFGGVGAGLAALSVHRFSADLERGSYAVSGVVVQKSERVGYTLVTLTDLSFDGVPVRGKMRAILSGGAVNLADELYLDATASSVSLKEIAPAYRGYYLTNNLRYEARSSSYVKTGESRDPFLRLRATVYRRFHENMSKDAADVCYALLFGDTSGMDGTLADAMRRGGIAHVFAVSGLHIGILYGAVQVLSHRLREYSFIPAVIVTLLYCALCGFPVSALRAFIMCTVIGVWTACGRKTDFLTAIGYAALAILLVFPAEWETVGFRLSFGAVLGIALFSDTIMRVTKKLPRFLSAYLAMSLSVQLFTFPILLESFGYFSVWGFALNFLLIPLIPVVFLAIFLCTLAAVVMPFGAAFFLSFPAATVAPLLYLFAVGDFSFVLAGFSLGMGGAVWLTGSVLLSERIRMRAWVRSVLAAGLAVLFSVTLILRNAVLGGCSVVYLNTKDGNAALFQTKSAHVLVIDGELSLADCEEFLQRNYGGTLDAVIILSENEIDGVNRAAFLNAAEIRVYRPLDTGLRETEVLYGETFSYGELAFRYETAERLIVLTEDVAVEVDFNGNGVSGADYCFGADTPAGLYRMKAGGVRKTGLA